METDVGRFTDGIVLLGVLAVVLVPLVVEGLKRLGMSVGWATPAAVAAGSLVAALVEVVRVWPETGPVVRILLAALVLGFGASGAYSQVRFLKKGHPSSGLAETKRL